MEQSNQILDFKSSKSNAAYAKGIDSIGYARFWATRVLSKVALGIGELTEENKEDLRSLNEILIKWGYSPLEGDF